ncbi:MAG: peptidoglycan DL-endopeptidase CwlO [Actinomycetota bacterium]|nr:peptidoglycan DL-endopeptidase CwlO [Actinomycetota bacterium]
MTMEQMVASIQQIQSTLSSLSRGVPPTPTGASSAGFDQIVAAMTPSVSTVTSASTPMSTPTAQSTSAAATAATSASASTSPATGTTGGSVTGADIVADAKKYIGVPYVLGGESTSGMDCSGLVQKVYKDEGVTLPRLVHEQKLDGTAVPSLAQAQPGDLIVFKGGGHIAIYAGNDTVIHAPYPGRTVSEQKLWVGDSGIETIRRIVPTTSAAPASNAAPASTSLKSAAPKPVAAAPFAAAPFASAPTTSAPSSQAPAIGTVDAFLSSMSNGISTDSVAEFLATQEAQMEQSQL